MTLLDNLKLITAIVTGAVGIVVVLSVGYCLWLTLVAVIDRLLTVKLLGPDTPSTRFCLLIPAHNEELVITHTLDGVLELQYPSELLNVIVIADNCTDGTARIASGYPGVRILARASTEQRGKGYALNWAIEQLAATDKIDAFVVLDADSKIDPSFLKEMDWHRRQVTGPFVAQGRYDVFNPNESWRTALMAGALALVHVVRPSARERLGLSVGLKGNGMAFDRSVVADVPWRGNSLTEDIDHALDILEILNVRVRYVRNARVAALMPSTAGGAASQRQRWEGGRKSVLRKRSLALLWKGISRFKPAYIDSALDLLVPPLAEMALLLVVWAVLVAVLAGIGGAWKVDALLALCSAFGLAAYVLIGFRLANAPALAYRALIYAPFYTVWKLAVRRRSSHGLAWIRTQREGAPGGESISLVREPEPEKTESGR